VRWAAAGARSPMSGPASSRLGAASGIVFVVALMATGGSEDTSSARLAAEVLALLLFVPFLAYLWSVLRPHDASAGGWLSATMLSFGLVALTVKVGSVIPVIALQRDDLSPTLDAPLQRVADIAFIVSLPPLGLCLGVVAAIVLRTRALPAWLGWLAAAAAPLLVANGLAVTSDEGPAFVLFLLWTLVTAVVLLRSAMTGELPLAARPLRRAQATRSP
jgi:uncharacterized protein DUF4386